MNEPGLREFARRFGLAAAVVSWVPGSTDLIGPDGVGLRRSRPHQPGEPTLAEVAWGPLVPAATLAADVAAPSSAELVQLAALRLGASERLLDAVVQRLRDRDSGGQPLLAQQSIRVRIGRVATLHVEAAAQLRLATREPSAAVHRRQAHAAIAAADAELVELHGAAGYERGSLGEDAHYADLLAMVFDPAESC